MSISITVFTDPKVLGGVLAIHGDNPHLVSLQATDEDNKHFCGASIIHPLFLISAAHCFEHRYSVPYIRAVAGEYDLSASEGTEQIRTVTAVIIHEQFNRATLDNDIALLVLNDSLTFNEKYVRPIPLWNSQWELPGKN